MEWKAVDCMVNEDLLLSVGELWGYKVGALEAFLQPHPGGWWFLLLEQGPFLHLGY